MFSRQNLWGLSNINSVVNPFASVNRYPTLPFIMNPNQQNVLRSFDSCTDPAGKSGVCIPGGLLCSKYGGRSSGSCTLAGLVCCVSK